MPRIGIIADDLTGSNATGVLLVRQGLRVVTLTGLAGGAEAGSPELAGRSTFGLDLAGFDAVVVNTDSRSLPARQAYDKVQQAGRYLKGQGVELFGKRIDSTIRGNPGAETEAILDLLGEDALAVVTPAYPSSGRIVVGGYLLVNGLPVQKTAIGTDPKTPVHQASVQRVLALQSSRRMGLLDIDTVLRGKEAAATALAAYHREGVRIVVADALTDEDIETVAAGMFAVAAERKIAVVAVDPGPLVGALGGLFAQKIPAVKGAPTAVKDAPAKESQATKQAAAKQNAAIWPSAARPDRPARHDGRILAVCGSVMELTRQQLAEAEKTFNAHFVDVNAWALVEGGNAWAEEKERVTGALLAGLAGHELLGLRTTRHARDVEETVARAKQAGLPQNELALRIARGLGLLTGAFLERQKEWEGRRGQVDGLFLTGGDVTVEVLRVLGSHGLEMRDQVAPLVACGTLFNGPYAGLPVVTKGGMVGDRMTIVEAVRYLQNQDL